MRHSTYNLFRLLYSDIDVNEALATDNIKINIVVLHASIHAFVYCSRKNRYHIILNESLSPEAMHHAFLHELNHIIEDIPKINYWVGIDHQRHYIENRANKFDQMASSYML